MRKRWVRLPPVMERTLRDDVKWALALMTGVTLGYFVFGVDDASLLLDYLVATAVVICVLTALRRVKHRRKT